MVTDTLEGSVPKAVPVRMIGAPPAVEPYGSEIAVTTGVASDLYSIFPKAGFVLVPSVKSRERVFESRDVIGSFTEV